MTGVVDGDEAALFVRAGPGEGHEGVPRPVPVPRRTALEEPPAAVAEGRVLEALEEAVVERGEPGVGRLARSAAEVDRDAHALSFSLALVEEPEAGREERQYGGRRVHLARERGGGPRLVVVLEEAGQAVLEVEARVEVLAHRAGVALHQPVVEPLVVGVVEALLLEGPLEVPVDLGEEQEARDLGAHGLRRARPERGGGDAPGLLEHLRQDEHRHVAADAVALARDALELAEHRLLQGRVAVVQLERVRPAVEVGIAPVSKDARALLRLGAAVVLGLRGELLFRSRDEEVRVLDHPAVVRRHVVRDEVEDEAQATTLEAPAETGERLVPAEVLVDPVVPDGEAGAGNVLLAEVGKDAVVLGEPLGVRPRDAPCGLAGLPDAEEPDEVEPVRGQPVELRVGDVVERRLSPQRGREFREPDPRVDLEERGIPRCRHGCPLVFVVLAQILTAHLLTDHAGLERRPGGFQRVRGRHASEEVEQTGN